MIYVSEVLLYVCFCLLVGSQLLSFVPAGHRPTIKVPNSVVYLSAIGIGLLSFMPLLEVSLQFTEEYEVGFWIIFQGVLLDFNIGHAWLLTIFLAAVLLVIMKLKDITKEPILQKSAAVVTFGLILAFGWASHCTASYDLKGFIPHTTHFFSVTVWIGTLLVAGWFSKDKANWGSFLRWFTPLALICLTLTISAGFYLMGLLVPSYVDSWIVPYGQALLIKHLLIIPLLTLAFVNGVLIRRKLKKNPEINPIPWVRAESVVALLVFSAMAVMGQQSPPESIAAIIKFEGPSWLFDHLYHEQISPSTTLQMDPGMISVILALISAIFLIAMVWVFRKRLSTMTAVGSGMLFVVSAYASLMVAVNS